MWSSAKFRWKTLDFREISEAPRLKKAWAIAHPTLSGLCEGEGTWGFLNLETFFCPENGDSGPCLSGARGSPQFLKKTLRECMGKWKYFMWVPPNSGNCSGSCSENCGFRIAQVVGCHSENGISYSENGISYSESYSENTQNSPRAPRMAFSLRELLFLKFGWSPGFWVWDPGESQDKSSVQNGEGVQAQRAYCQDSCWASLKGGGVRKGLENPNLLK